MVTLEIGIVVHHVKDDHQADAKQDAEDNTVDQDMAFHVNGGFAVNLLPAHETGLIL